MAMSCPLFLVRKIDIHINRYSEEEKQTHIFLWQESGLSKLGYSKEIGISYKTFLHWCKRYTINKDLPQEVESQSFIPISIPASTLKSYDSVMIELEYPTGVIVRLPMNFPMDKLKALLV